MKNSELYTEAKVALEGFIKTGVVGLLQKAKDRLTLAGVRAEWMATKEDAEHVIRHLYLHRLV